MLRRSFLKRQTIGNMQGGVKNSIFDFVVLDGRGQEYPLAQHRGKIVSVVNYASH